MTRWKQKWIEADAGRASLNIECSALRARLGIAHEELAALRVAIETARSLLTPAPSLVTAPEPSAEQWSPLDPPDGETFPPCKDCGFTSGHDPLCRQRRLANESAEAQLAAVRAAVNEARANHPHWKGWEPILSALTPAPSPGAGEKT